MTNMMMMMMIMIIIIKKCSKRGKTYNIKISVEGLSECGM
jgi:hypothetical protein